MKAMRANVSVGLGRAGLVPDLWMPLSAWSRIVQQCQPTCSCHWCSRSCGASAAASVTAVFGDLRGVSPSPPPSRSPKPALEAGAPASAISGGHRCWAGSAEPPPACGGVSAARPCGVHQAHVRCHSGAELELVVSQSFAINASCATRSANVKLSFGWTFSMSPAASPAGACRRLMA